MTAVTSFFVEKSTDVGDDDVVSYTGSVRAHPRVQGRYIMNGKGEATMRDGRVYEGECNLGMFHGLGVMHFPDGTLYDGQWDSHLASGYGAMDGPLVDGKPSWTYVGLFRRGEKEGQGEETCRSGERYVGTFRDGKRQGVGRLTLACGDIIDGTFAAGALHGLATWTFAHGDVLVGRFVHGLLQGDVTYTQIATGNVFTETFVDDVCVKGVLCDPPHCAVTYAATGARYVGGWQRLAAGTNRNGLREGYGTLTFPNGDVYTGQFAADDFEGEGVITYNTDAPMEAAIDADEGDGVGVGEGLVNPLSSSGDDRSDDDNNEDDQQSVASDDVEGTVEETWRNTTAFDERTLNGRKVVSFRGMFHRGVRDGRGFVTTDDSAVLEGFWSRARRHGVFHRANSGAATAVTALASHHYCLDLAMKSHREADDLASRVISRELKERRAEKSVMFAD